MVSVAIIAAAVPGARRSRRQAYSASRAQSPARRHATEGRSRSPAPLRSASHSAPIHTAATPILPRRCHAARARSRYASAAGLPISSRKSGG
jgi:hypothetical protein